MSSNKRLASNVAIDEADVGANIDADASAPKRVGTLSRAKALGMGPDLSGEDVETRFIASVGLGVDIVDVQRLQTLYERWRECFLVRLFTDQELIICRKASGYRWRSLAGRFSAKEAVKKILASRGEIASWRDIEVLNGPYGEPYINLHGRAKSAVERLGYSSLVLSISHDASLAIATVMAY
jgi:holo-[acyl-carrier protein] synthase